MDILRNQRCVHPILYICGVRCKRTISLKWRTGFCFLHHYHHSFLYSHKWDEKESKIKFINLRLRFCVTWRVLLVRDTLLLVDAFLLDIHVLPVFLLDDLLQLLFCRLYWRWPTRPVLRLWWTTTQSGHRRCALVQSTSSSLTMKCLRQRHHRRWVDCSSRVISRIIAAQLQHCCLLLMETVKLLVDFSQLEYRPTVMRIEEKACLRQWCMLRRFYQCIMFCTLDLAVSHLQILVGECAKHARYTLTNTYNKTLYNWAFFVDPHAKNPFMIFFYNKKVSI